MMRKVIFRADGNLKIGYGHFIRTLGIAGIINKDFNCIYATQQPTEYQINEIKKACSEYISLNANDNHFDEFLTHLKGDEIVLLDNYYFSSAYQNKIRKKGCKVIYIDDLNKKKFLCDALINNIPGYSKKSFKRAPYTKLYLGSDYALLRKEFLDAKWRKVKRKSGKIFLSFGGSDAKNITGKVIKFLYEINSKFDLNVLIGDAFEQQEELAKYKNLNVYKNINANAVANLMSSSEVCIITASSLLNETSCVGSKILVGYCANNQIQPYTYFVQKKFALGAGDFRTLKLNDFKKQLAATFKADYLIENQKKQYRFQQENNIREIFNNI